MERNHMLPSDRETESRHPLGPPPARPSPSLMALSPPAYSNLALPSPRDFPDVPATDPSTFLPPLARVGADNDIKLPSISSLRSEMALEPPRTWGPLPPMPPNHAMPMGLPSIDSPTRMDLDASSNSVISAASPDRLLDARAGSVSLDDPDVRLAAEALGDLRAGVKKRRKVDSEDEAVSNKRFESEGMQQISDEQLDDAFSPSSRTLSRRMSTTSTVDTLPAYDEMRSPAYTETDAQDSPRSTPRPNSAWQSRLIMSTSGLSVAMSDESLRSLKYCLQWLRWANDHISRVIMALKTTLEQYEKVQPQEGSEKQIGQGSETESRTLLAARISSLKSDVLKTLRDAINTVSKYAGGALPENARILVRRHLTSLPQRFRIATMSDRNPNSQQDSESVLTESAQKVLVLAKEGLDMVVQVSGVVDGTIVSAEQWLDRMGSKRRAPDEKPVLPQTESNGDVKMG
ncbi:hypothetical protein FGSG_08981 [Fusarium graminearum PH-1]|uniref:hypothetical protein n=1 Tax=Gibberella zeae (strain ATCC MYA-4620 / CBS 123657 / FGSC 9075 / NRRL 31084 / PH-1) TaxID=229533 RepID=UPI00021F1329|nr:hypothetical protein FGSG_08981 [Fusarium graminearum PH-1]ESU15487.1 hypothetical protein FGSG_08981 [Fusarium graminearum PH-1]|eukprot:XP_011328829.1 hypothetical protein FGSG_08981 [Fusarium graminearum PH-1]